MHMIKSPLSEFALSLRQSKKGIKLDFKCKSTTLVLRLGKSNHRILKVNFCIFRKGQGRLTKLSPLKVLQFPIIESF